MASTVKQSPAKNAVLLMAHGGPDTLSDIEPFLTHIIKHRTSAPPAPELVATVRSRYEQIGGRSPLLEITQQQAARLEALLNTTQESFRVYVGMRHWAPFIEETVQQIVHDRPERLVAISMTPQYSRMSVGAYINAAKDALTRAGAGTLPVSFVTSWHDQPLLLDAFSKKIKETFVRDTAGNNPFLLFTAHSLPASIVAENDPYPTHLQETVGGIVKRLSLLPNQWGFAYQSQGMSGGVWMRPDITEMFDSIASTSTVLVAPIGFIADNVEILYDVDIYYKEAASQKGIVLQRIESLNATPLLISALAAVVHTHLPA